MQLKSDASCSITDGVPQENETSQKKTRLISEKLCRKSSLYQGILNCSGKDTADDRMMHSSCENIEDLRKTLKIEGTIVISDSEDSEEDRRPSKFTKIKRGGN